VNGEPAEKLAIHNQLKPGDRVRWIYKKDVCSQKVDNQTSEQVKKESNKE